MRRLRQRQRQQRNIWTMLEIKRNKQSAIIKISDIISKNKRKARTDELIKNHKRFR